MPVNRGVGPRNIGAVGVTPREHRLTLAGLIAESAPGIPRVGLLKPSTTNVVTGTSGMAYSVGPCNPVINRGEGDGVYLPTFTGTTAVGTDPSPGTGFRYDLIWVFQNDPDKTDLVSGAPSNVALFGVTRGTAAAAPTRPTASVPAGALILAEALVPAGATRTDGAGGGAIVTMAQVWRHTCARGAPIPVRDAAERNEITARPGDLVQRLDLGGILERYENGAWGVRETAVPFTDGGTATGWQNVAGTLPLRVESEGRQAHLEGYVVRAGASTNNVIGVIPTGLRPRKDITWTERGQNSGNQEGPTFRIYLNASSGVLNVNRMLGGPTWNNDTTLLPISKGYQLP